MSSREISRIELEGFVGLRTTRDENRKIVRHLLAKYADAVEAGYLESALTPTDREPPVPPGLYDRAFALAMEIPLPPQIPPEPSVTSENDVDETFDERLVG